MSAYTLCRGMEVAMFMLRIYDSEEEKQCPCLNQESATTLCMFKVPHYLV